MDEVTEVTRALEIKDDGIVMITTSTKVEVSELVVDLVKLQKMVDNINSSIANTEKEKIRKQTMLAEELARLDIQVGIWQKEVEELNKQITTFKELEKELPPVTNEG